MEEGKVGFRPSEIVSIILLSLILSVSSIRTWNTYMYDSTLLNRIVMVLLVLLTLLFFVSNINKIVRCFPFLFAVLFTVVFHYLVYSENRQYIEFQLGDCWIYLVALFMCSYSMDTKALFWSFTISSILVLFFDLLLLNTVFFKSLTEYEYGGAGAVYSYSLLFPAVFFIYLSKIKNKIVYLILSFLPALIIFIFGGNRGSLLCYFLCLFYVYVWPYLKRINISKLVVGGMLALLFLLILPSLLDQVFSFLGIETFSPRILDMLTSGSQSSDSGRGGLRSELYERLFSSEGIIGFGIMGDRVITRSHQYSHNMILELLVDFGWFLGSLIFLLLLLMLYSAYQKKSNKWVFVEIILFTKVISLWVSGTFWDDYFFWMMIAILLKIIHTKKLKNEDIAYNKYRC